jgi:glycine/D-amino acid oxidase-like deaminating enzyme
MDLKSGYPFWPIRNGLMTQVPPLEDDARCDVAVIGGGITGALVAHELASHGHEVIVLERRDVAWGSTAASTALLQYEIDASLGDLSRSVGTEAAAAVYLACADAIDRLAALARDVGDVGFARRQSLYYASRVADVAALEAECAARDALGLRVQWLQRDALAERFGLAAPAAILSAKAASMDPYRMASRLLARLRRGGTRVHDRTCVGALHPRPRGVDLVLENGATVRAGHAVIAAGYESQAWLEQRVARNRSTYAFVTDPLPEDALGELARTLVWETARPYLYLRTTDDGRLLVGGADDTTDVPSRRDRRVEAKTRRLVGAVRRRFAALDLAPAYAWAGTFAETADALPWFGAHPQWGPRVLFAMAYGGNGITYSTIGAGMLRALVERRRHPLADVFGFGRRERD